MTEVFPIKALDKVFFFLSFFIHGKHFILQFNCNLFLKVFTAILLWNNGFSHFYFWETFVEQFTVKYWKSFSTHFELCVSIMDGEILVFYGFLWRIFWELCLGKWWNMHVYWFSFTNFWRMRMWRKALQNMF